MIKKANKKEIYLFFLLGYFFSLFIGLHFQRAFNVYGSLAKLDKIIKLTEESIKTSFILIPNKSEFRLVLFITIIWGIILALKLSDSKIYMNGKEYGSAKWATKNEKEKFKDKDIDNNAILSSDVFMSIEHNKIHRTLNTIVLGSPGTGKSRFIVKPNLMQVNCNFIATDPKGELFNDTKYMFEYFKYKIKVFNVKDVANSMKYNPFEYFRTDRDIKAFITSLIKNTNDGQSSSEPFWEHAETNLYLALIYYLYYEAPSYEQNLPMVKELLNYCYASDDENYKCELDILFEELEKEKPNHIAVASYKDFKSGAGDTLKSILISAKSRLSFLNIESMKELLSEDELKIDELIYEKSILYIIVPDSDSSYNFLAAILYTQLFDVLMRISDEEFNGKTPYHIRMMLDEYANIGKIPRFDEMITTIRSRNISATIILQSMSQLEAMHKERWKAVVDGCDNIIFLGGRESCEYMSKNLGKATIDSKVVNYTKGKNSSSSINNSKLGRELMTKDELMRMDDRDSIVMIRGMNPCFSKKFDIEKHKNYALLGNKITIKTLKQNIELVEKIQDLI